MSETLKEIVNKVNAAFAANDFDGFLSHCADDLEWTMVGDSTMKGKASVSEFLATAPPEPPVFTVEATLSGEDSVTCFGDMTMKGTDGIEAPYSYCDVYRFNGDKIRSLHSFVVKHQTEGKESEKAAA